MHILDEDDELPRNGFTDKMAEKAEEFLREVLSDEEWYDDHHLNTPKRFAKMLYDMTHPPPFEFTTFSNELGLNEMITKVDIPFYSLCAHHLAPFYGVAHVAYIPDKKLAGLSKLVRVVKNTAKGLWVQEHLNDMVSLHLEENLKPLGTAVIMRAEHLCESMRGAETAGTKTITSTMTGVFLDPERKARDEFLALIQMNSEVR